ncbi:MAG: glucose dehydrogenase [Rhodospirillaceae bacterium]|nr:glucose dehydrogenase [Rhodospirillaceae bacterium]|tara:strand:- start:541 stop:1728 length:1188 start_codon:yes stop_codon:yes gene_type:complete
MSGKLKILSCLILTLAACSGTNGPLHAQNSDFTTTRHGQFDIPWALEFLPDGRLMISEGEGSIKLLDTDSGAIGEITGLPEVSYGGQGGMGDVVLHPDFQENNLVYISYVEAGDGDTSGAAVASAELNLNGNGGELTNVDVLWRQIPKVTGQGHYGHRIAFGPDGYLWISSGDRQKFDPSQDLGTNIGKVVRLNMDGSVPNDNPFNVRGGVSAEIWSLGHRNPLGLAFDAQGQLWNIEMGPKHGDELNMIERGANFGYPIVSNGDHYDTQSIPDHPLSYRTAAAIRDHGLEIPDHDLHPEFDVPSAYWVPAISPSSLMFYSGSEFPEWNGDAFIGGLSSQAIIRVEFDGESAQEVERLEVEGRRIRDIEQGPDGAIWVLEDGRRGDGNLFKLMAP